VRSEKERRREEGKKKKRKRKNGKARSPRLAFEKNVGLRLRRFLFNLSPLLSSIPRSRFLLSLSLNSSLTMFALKSSVVSRAAAVAPRRQVRGWRAGVGRRSLACLPFLKR